MQTTDEHVPQAAAPYQQHTADSTQRLQRLHWQTVCGLHQASSSLSIHSNNEPVDEGVAATKRHGHPLVVDAIAAPASEATSYPMDTTQLHHQPLTPSLTRSLTAARHMQSSTHSLTRQHSQTAQ